MLTPASATPRRTAAAEPGRFSTGVATTSRSAWISSPASMSAVPSDEERLAAGAGPDVVRLSVGIESVEDLIADLERALTAVG